MSSHKLNGWWGSAVFLMGSAETIPIRDLYTWTTINPYPAQLIDLNFHPPEVVSPYRNPQLQLGKNYSYLNNLRSILCKS